MTEGPRPPDADGPAASGVYGASSYQVVVNGVTGRIAGSRPWSWIKITLLVIALLFVFILYVYNQ